MPAWRQNNRQRKNEDVCNLRSFSLKLYVIHATQITGSIDKHVLELDARNTICTHAKRSNHPRFSTREFIERALRESILLIGFRRAALSTYG